MHIVVILSILLISLFSFAQNIEALLEEYKEKVYEETEDQTLGYAYIFTRDDIENLQAHTLGDILKLIPYLYYIPNRFGVESLSEVPIENIPTYKRIFIDDHEISSIHTLSPFLVYDEYPLTNIDHIEIYLIDINSKLSSENGVVLVKLYTKDPRKENISVSKGLYDSKKSYSLFFSDARQISQNISYFISLSKTEKNFYKPRINGKNISRNQDGLYSYLKFNYFDTTVQISASRVRRGIFGGFSTDLAPDYGDIRSLDTFFSMSQKLLNNKSLELLISYDWQERNTEEENKDTFIFLLPFYNPSYGNLYYYRDKRSFGKFVTSLKKTFNSEKNKFFMGFDFRNYTQNAKADLKYQLREIKNFKPRYEKYLHIYSIYADELYRLNENLELNFSLRLDGYDWNKNEDFIDENGKIGFLYHKNKFLLKIFSSISHLVPSMFQAENSATGKLKSSRYKAIMIATKYKLEKHNEIRFYFGRAEIKNLVTLSRQGFINDPSTITGRLVTLEYLHRFHSTMFNFQVWHTHYDLSKNTIRNTGFNLTAYSSFKNINYFVSLIYKQPENVKYVSRSFDASLGFGYKFKDGFSVSFKGENIFDKGQKVYYRTVLQEGAYKSIGRRFTFSIEKVF